MAAVISKRHKPAPAIATTSPSGKDSTTNTIAPAAAIARSSGPAAVATNAVANAAGNGVPALHRDIAEIVASFPLYMPSDRVQCVMVEGDGGAVCLRRSTAIPNVLKEEIARRVDKEGWDEGPLGGGPLTPSAVSTQASNNASFSGRPSGRPSVIDPTAAVTGGSDDGDGKESLRCRRAAVDLTATIEVVLSVRASNLLTFSSSPQSPSYEWMVRPSAALYRPTHGVSGVGLGLSNSTLTRVVYKSIRDLRTKQQSQANSHPDIIFGSFSPTPPSASFPTSPSSQSVPTYSARQTLLSELLAIARRLAVLEVDERSFILGCQLQGIVDEEGADGDVTETPEDNYHRHTNFSFSFNLRNVSHSNNNEFISPTSFPSISASTSSLASPQNPLLLGTHSLILAAVKKFNIPLPPHFGATFAPNGSAISWGIQLSKNKPLYKQLADDSFNNVSIIKSMKLENSSPPRATATDNRLAREESSSSAGGWQSSTRAPTMVLSSISQDYAASTDADSTMGPGRAYIMMRTKAPTDEQGVSASFPSLLGLDPTEGYLPEGILQAVVLAPRTSITRCTREGVREVLHRNGMLCGKVFFRKMFDERSNGNMINSSFDVYPLFHLLPTSGGALPMLFQTLSSVCLLDNDSEVKETLSSPESGLLPAALTDTADLEFRHYSSIVLPLLKELSALAAPMHSRSLFWLGVACCNICLPLLDAACCMAGRSIPQVEAHIGKCYELLRVYVSDSHLYQGISIVSQVFAVTGDVVKQREASLLLDHLRLASSYVAGNTSSSTNLLHEHRKLLFLQHSGGSSVVNEESGTLASTLISQYLGPRDGHAHTTPSTPFNIWPGSFNTAAHSTPPTAPLSRQTTLTPIPTTTPSASRSPMLVPHASNSAHASPPAPPPSTQSNPVTGAVSTTLRASHASSGSTINTHLPSCVVCLKECIIGTTAVWCARCGHGGHKEHLIGWIMRGNTECPKGCGCSCDYAGL